MERRRPVCLVKPDSANNAPASDPSLVWQRVLSRLQLNTGEAHFDTYLRDTRGLAYDPGASVIRVAAANPYAWFPLERSADELITPTADNLEAFLSAAMINKQVPVTVVSRPERATLMLTVSAVDIQRPSAGAKLARCLVASCASLKDRGATSVQLVKGDTIVWSYTVNKGRAEKDRQSVAEAIAKQLKADYFRNNPTAGGVRARNTSPELARVIRHE